MRYLYEAEFTYDEHDGVWYVEFDGFDGSAYADGATLAEAASNAADVLALTLCDYLDSGTPLPPPVFSDPPRSVVCVDVDDEDIALTKCMTVTEAAEYLDVTPGRVSQLLSSGKLEAYEHGGTRYVTIASVSERKANPPAPHRPKLAAVGAPA